ncbi:MAG: type VI secretion system-associated protein TagO, partial [Paracoccaceae bacterium]|nr:type VI secretion system-associated protein TagO [Paracoccaceae bacterium]
WMYYHGKGVPRDYVEAAKWWRLAAEQGHAEAQARLGALDFDGENVPQDYSEAVNRYQLAAQQGQAEAQLLLGFMYKHGEGVPQDVGETVKWFHLAAEQGHAEAQVQLGFMYKHGEGVPQDAGEAVKWFHLAAEQGHAEAHDSLALADLETGNWEISSSEDPLDDSVSVSITLVDESETKGAIHISCGDNETDVSTVWIDGIMNFNRYTRITIRFDKEQKAEMDWKSTHSQIAYLPPEEGIDFIKEMFGHERLILRAIGRGTMIDAIYNIKGIENAVKPIREACNW